VAWRLFRLRPVASGHGLFLLTGRFSERATRAAGSSTPVRRAVNRTSPEGARELGRSLQSNGAYRSPCSRWGALTSLEHTEPSDEPDLRTCEAIAGERKPATAVLAKTKQHFPTENCCGRSSRAATHRLRAFRSRSDRGRGRGAHRLGKYGCAVALAHSPRCWWGLLAPGQLSFSLGCLPGRVLGLPGVF
jgi:hypothetical protein